MLVVPTWGQKGGRPPEYVVRNQPLDLEAPNEASGPASAPSRGRSVGKTSQNAAFLLCKM